MRLLLIILCALSLQTTNTTIHISGVSRSRNITWTAQGDYMHIEREKIPTDGQSFVVFDNATVLHQEYTLNDFNSVCPCLYTFVEAGQTIQTKILSFVYMPFVVK